MSFIKTSSWRTSWLVNFLDDHFLNEDYHMRANRFISANVRETEKSYEVEMGVPGFDKKDVSISFEKGLLTVSGTKKTGDESNNRPHRRQEFNCTSFSGSFSLPVNVDEEDAHAKIENGILKLSISKKIKESTTTTIDLT